ncbi:MAG: Unknown protein [uncultured Campylobacterales bacterium]|uniref:AMIN domain-containing protein n=1 Tax=uncultured Campylobacterales bacterium TaxID=352960 RepID=A0A6S6SEG7_9BACT|nr:MAG: Unknown protein [uncultured Campylobacterales bacterium]
MKKYLISSVLSTSLLMSAQACTDSSIINTMPAFSQPIEKPQDTATITSYSDRTLVFNIDDFVLNVNNDELIFNTDKEVLKHFFMYSDNRIVIDFKGLINFNVNSISTNIKAIKSIKFGQHKDFSRVVVVLRKKLKYDFIDSKNLKLFKFQN